MNNYFWGRESSESAEGRGLRMFVASGVIGLRILFMFAVTLLAWPGNAAVAGEISGTATVIDASTMEVAGRKVRLFGIQPPEPDQVCKWPNTEIPCGRIAATALMDLVFKATVVCRPTGEKDTDGTEIATCHADGFDVGRNMVHTGWARAMPRLMPSYLPVERAAERAKRGVWRGGASGWKAR